MQPPVYIIVNPNCHLGRGWKKWLSVKNAVFDLLPGAIEIVTKETSDLEEFVTRFAGSTEEACFISAGGDGSLHQLANILLRTKNNERFRLGAIGLGSSNDFLKPFQSFINSIPVRINTTKQPVLQDIGRLRYTDEHKVEKEKFFLINASFGVTAEGNWHFNNPGPVLKWLKKTSVGAAIKYTAITTILRYKNKPVITHFNGEERFMAVSNINILKSPYVSGSLRYKQDILPDDGRLGLNICMNMKKKELLQTLFHLEKGQFETNHKKVSVFTNNFLLSAASPLVFECDGETERSAQVEISVVPGAIRLLTA